MAATEPDRFAGGVTVLMSVYGRDDAGLFRRALDTLFAGTVLPDAMVLVVDGPVGVGLEEQISRAEREHGVRVHRLPRNAGLATALNEGLALVVTEWVLRADADDLNVPERLAIQARFASRNPRVDLFGGYIDEFSASGARLARREVPLAEPHIRTWARRRNPFNHMTVAFRTQPVRRAGGYPALHLREDYGLWASLLLAGATVANIPEVLVHATTGPDMYRRRGGWRYARGEWELQRHLVRCGLKSWPQALLDTVSRGLVFLMPAGVRSRIYERLLRRSAG